MRLTPSLLLLPLLAACQSSPPVTAHAFKPSEVSEAVVLPPGYQSGERLEASCARVSLAEGRADVELADVDCSFERLTRTLKARAGESSASLIVGKRCRSSARGRSLSCSANVAQPTSALSFAAREGRAEVGPAPSAAQVLDLDEPRPQNASQIRVGFAPIGQPTMRLTPRSYDAVAETAVPSVGRQALGEVSAACESCAVDELRHALRVTAGRLGAGEISGVRCFEDDSRSRCVASVLVPWSS